MVPRSPPQLSSSTTDCANCIYLMTEIRNQLDAFITMTTVNPKLSWQILVDSFERITVPRDVTSEVEPTGYNSVLAVQPADTHVEDPLKEKDHVSTVNFVQPATVVEQKDEALNENTKNNGNHNDDGKEPDYESKLNNSDAEGGKQDVPILPFQKKVDETCQGTTDSKLIVSNGEHNLLTPASLLAADEFIRTSCQNEKSTYHCLKCSYTQNQKRIMRLHVRRVHFSERVPCPTCTRRFYGSKELAMHARTCSRDGVPAGLVDLWSKMKMAEKTYRKFKKEYELKIEIARGGKGNGPITVTNPFAGFDLTHALTVQVKVERMPGVPARPPRKGPRKLKRGQPIGPSSRMKLGPAEKEQWPRKKKIAKDDTVSKSIIINSIFGGQLKSPSGNDLSTTKLMEKSSPLEIKQPVPSVNEGGAEGPQTIAKENEQNQARNIKRVKLQHIDDKIRTQLVICGLGEGSETEELTESGFECVVCDKAYHNLSLIRRHVRMTHF